MEMQYISLYVVSRGDVLLLLNCATFDIYTATDIFSETMRWI